MTKIFTATKSILMQEVDVMCSSINIIPPTTEEDKDIPARVNFGIKGVSLAELKDQEWTRIKDMLIVIANRVPNLKNINALI